MLRTGEGVTANADDERLAKADVCSLSDGLVCQGTRTRDDTDLARLVDVTGLDTQLASGRVDDTRAVRSNETRL